MCEPYFFVSTRKGCWPKHAVEARMSRVSQMLHLKRKCLQPVTDAVNVRANRIFLGPWWKSPQMMQLKLVDVTDVSIVLN